MKIIKRWGKRYLKKECLFCRQEFKTARNDVKIDSHNGIIAWGRCTCPHCGKENVINSYYVRELYK